MKKIIVALASLISMAAMAQENTGEMQLSLKQAVENALNYSKQLQSSKHDVDIYKEKIREAISSGLPQASARLGYTTYFGAELKMGSLTSGGGAMLESMGKVFQTLPGIDIDKIVEAANNQTSGGMKMENNLQLTASVSYTLALQQLAGVKVARIAASIYETTDESATVDVKANVTDTYYAILVYKRNLDILASNLKDLEEIEKHTAHSFAAGVCEQTDVDQIHVTVAQLKNTIISTERNYDVTKRLLVLQMGLPITTRITPAESLDAMISETTIATRDSSNFDINNNVTYRQLEKSRQLNEASLKMQKMAYVPTLTASYQFTKNITGGFMSFPNLGTLTLNVPIFQGFARDSRVKQAKLEIAKTDTQMALLQDNLMQNDEQYRYELNSAIDAYLLQKENLDVARRVLDNYKNKYNQGVLSSLDLTQANTNYLSAETSYASAIMTLLQAHTKLNKLYNSFGY
ncbi:MAG: TolC family protein [Bacteroidales bacterium]|nr:TolC family protein [Bacteroidales bacterium]